jgi:phosphoribosylformylglycinamidine cyclo-ligase
MMPTTIYVKPILALLRERPGTIHGMAHVTGGGLQENIIRVVPDGLGLAIDSSSWKLPPVFEWLQHEGKVAREEMWRTFNCGIGFTVILAPGDVDGVQAALAQSGLASWGIGEVVETTDGNRVRIA